MKKKSLLLLPLSVLALTSCGKTVNIKDDQNYDVDPTSSITDDGGENDFDSMSVEEENVEVPSEYDSFSDNTIADEGKYYLKGGVVIVEGPGSGNGSLDAEKVYFQGGIVFACSTSGMRESMSATQNTFLYQGSTIASGSKISIVDSSDNALFSYTLKQSCNQIIFSHKDLALKSTYRIVNGSTEVASITMSSSLTTVGSSSGGPGGGGPGGGGGWH